MLFPREAEAVLVRVPFFDESLPLGMASSHTQEERERETLHLFQPRIGLVGHVVAMGKRFAKAI